MGGDLTGGQPPRGKRQHDLVDAIQPPLPLAHQLRGETAVAITRHLDLDRADLSQHRLGPGAVARVAAIAAGGLVLVVAQVLAHLRIQSGLEHLLGQPRQRAVRADQVDPIGAGLVHQFLRELLLINLSRHRLDALGHYQSFPAKQSRSACQDRLHRCSDRPPGYRGGARRVGHVDYVRCPAPDSPLAEPTSLHEQPARAGSRRRRSLPDVES